AAMDHSKMDHGSMPMPVEPQPSSPTPTPTPSQPIPNDHPTLDHSTMGQESVAGGEHAGHGAMNGAFGPYPMTRESSGTAWQPDASEHVGVMEMGDEWTLMGHGTLNLIYDHQSGRRGDGKAFVSGMLMGIAQRPIGHGTPRVRA